MKIQKEKISKNALKLALLCCFVYFVAYIGRLSYSANIVMIREFFVIDKGTAGIAGTCLFISYGVGQVFNGLMCKRYNPRYAITIALVGSSLCNLLVAFTDSSSFYLVCIFWFVNGFTQSILWSSIIRMLNRNLASIHLRKAIIIMGLPVSLGTFTVYGISSLFASINLSFKFVFIVASALMLIMACIWFVLVDKFKNNCAKERDELDGAMTEPQSIEKKDKKRLPQGFIAIFSILALFAVVNNFIKDGVTTWTPSILKEKYNLDDAISTFLTLFLPLFAVFGSILAVNLSKKFKSYITICGIFYTSAFVFMLLVVLFIDLPIWIITIICFILVSMSMAAVNNVLTSIFPMLYSKDINAGTLAGVLDGFCYVGSAITTYGLGSISDRWGWDTVFVLLLSLCAVMVLVCLVYMICQKKIKK